MVGISILPLNVASLNNMVRWNRIKNVLRHLAVNIVFLQETHLKKQEEQYFRQMFWGYVYHASSRAHTKGVMLGIRGKIPWQPKYVYLDKNGGFIVLQGCLNFLIITVGFWG